MRKILLLLPVFGLLAATPVLADVAVAGAPTATAQVGGVPAVVEASPAAVMIPYGDWIVAISQVARDVLIPVVVGLIGIAVQRVAPWAQLFLTQARTEQMAQAVTDYGLNAVKEAAKDKHLDIPVASAVIAKAVQRAVDVVPKKVIDAVGGPAGVAELVFRKLKLEPGASAANVLAPVIEGLPKKV